MKLQLTLPAALQSTMMRFDSMSLRERALIGAALIGCLLVIWDSVLMQPLNARRAALVALLDNAAAATTQAEALPVDADTVDASATDDGQPSGDPDPIGTALLQRESLRARLSEVNQQLQRASAELIAPERMSEVLYDVLRQQRGVTLISLHNKPVSSLAFAQIQSTQTQSTQTPPGDAPGPGDRQPGAGLYLHPVELVVDGRYLDILGYLRALEALPWHFQWQALQLDGNQPLSRVRIELGTLSLDPAWLGT